MEKTLEKNYILEFKNVTGKGKKFKLSNIDFAIQPGFIYALVGKNGAGKTTFMRYILNEFEKYDGTIYIDGKDIKNNHFEKMNKIGYVSEDNNFFDNCMAEENVKFLSCFYDDFDMDIYKNMMNKMEVPSSRIYGKMSRGEKLKFQLAFAIAHKPKLYLLDEVTAGMDPVFRREFFEIIQGLIINEDCSILMTSHIESEIEEKTDYVGIIDEGKLIDFGESEVLIPKLRKARGEKQYA